ncbi:MAG: NAD(P)H-hydrate dehydratase [Erysipelotrichaceae bacterium]|nr:NAD(P)H-hydrate dehydratase [Erysipelotrichaceae bacterium]
MNKEEFFSHYPIRKTDSNKYDNGVVSFVSGSYGMAGAALFNLLGARSAGASYIHSYLPETIYPIVAGNEPSAVYHPYDPEDRDFFKDIVLRKVKAAAFGSGCDDLAYKENYLKDLIGLCDVPLIIDAAGLRILAQDPELYNEGKTLILTPHMGEFSALCRRPVKEIEEDKMTLAVNYAREHHVILVLKGPETLVIDPKGEVYVNHSGNPSLARAGSGDILTGMIAGLCSLYEDPYQAVKDGVWLHGHLADEALKTGSMEVFDLRLYPWLADRFFHSFDEHLKKRILS